MTPIMPQVKNIVMLMLENRSLDNLLGWLYDGDQPEHVFPQTVRPPTTASSPVATSTRRRSGRARSSSTPSCRCRTISAATSTGCPPTTPTSR